MNPDGTDGTSAAGVTAAIRRTGLTRVVHFTPALNLDGILRDGMLRDTVALDADGQPHHTTTDTNRIDSRPELICCSLQYPNAYYQAQARVRPQFVNYPGWVSLLLRPETLLAPGTLFHPCNAATGGGVYGETGGAAMLRMWDTPSAPNRRTRTATHLRNVPTDLQAEVQIPGPILMSEVTAIVTSTPGQARELFGHYLQMGLNPGQVEWRYSPLFFDKFGLRDAIHRGGPITETVWTPTEQDLT